MSNKLADLDKSLELAECLNMMKPFVHMIDLDYLKLMSKNFYDQASFEDSAAVLNSNYSPIKSEIIRKQAKAMSLLSEFIELLKEVDEGKAKLNKEQSTKQAIAKLFL